ncbi:hypothetical protein C3492_36740 [Streptomyces sp. Ru62]|uniref:hypothetical protein n=1 Tax=Streptomyces sp. Ru62 TaxID=2080745 RepID=UPI000CDD5170|nr:hypothetical protein [Streptomyces sp. Ru62]POX58607.1 hypothetical protein C3492_36740 [Streptomyces sp. Ru62]
MPNGWTETLDADTITPTALATLVESTIGHLTGMVKPVPGNQILRPQRWGTLSDTYLTAPRRPSAGKAGRGQLGLF